VELVVGIMDKLDLLQFPLFGGVESCLFFSERVFESGSLSIDGLIEGIIVVVECIIEGSRISDKTCVESSSLAGKSVGKGSLCIRLGSFLSFLHVEYKILHVGQSLLNGSLELSLLVINKRLKDVAGGIFIMCKCSLEFANLVNGIFAKSIHLSEELVESVVYGIKSSKVSVGESLLQLSKESFACSPSLLVLGGKSISEAMSDVTNDFSKFRASGCESRDKLGSAGWKFAEEELYCSLNLLLKILITDSVSVVLSISRVENAVDFSLNFVAVDIAVDFAVLKGLRMVWSIVLVGWDVTVIRLFWIYKWSWLEACTLGDRWLS
jgi:hypothetical protein